MPFRRPNLGRVAAACGVVALLAPFAAHATAPSSAGRLARALRAPLISSTKSAAIAIDLATGQTLFARNADAPLAPASNEKLAVTYGALVSLGPNYEFQTAVLGEGHREGSTWVGRLVLKGYGDPTLDTQSLARLAQKLRDLGIRTVTGGVAGDDSWFDERWTAPGWRPSFFGVESAQLSALLVNADWGPGSISRHPALSAAKLFKGLLARQGIKTGRADLGRANSSAVMLVSIHSHKLSLLLRDMDTYSDNFVAETVLKEIGAETAGIGSTAAGARVVRDDLAAAGIPLGGTRMADGSGLSRLDRMTANELSSLLLAFWQNPTWRPILHDSLAIAGETGTLQDRLAGRGTRGVVRAKTGTTSQASALSGYVGSRFAFVLLENGHPVDLSAAHALQDAFVRALASEKPL